MAITPLPPAPLVTDSPAEFNTKAFALVNSLNGFVTETNALALEVDADAAVAAEAITASEAAVAAANFKGAWSSLNGALNIPASVSHNGSVWVLTQNLADVTANEPGVDSPNYWLSVTLTPAGSAGNVLTSNGTDWIAALPREKTWTAFTATGTYTVPANVSSIRVYAFGGGGNGGASTAQASRGGGGGGGCAFGDIAVTPGSTVSINITSKVAKVTYASVNVLVANPGNNGGAAGGTGGTATKHASVTNGGAYTGGAGGAGQAGGGGAAASPLGNGYTGGSGGGAGAGGTGSGSAGGGAGGDAFSTNPGGAGGAATAIKAGIGRSYVNRFTDPLMSICDAPGGKNNQNGYNGAGGGVDADGGFFGGGGTQGASTTQGAGGSVFGGGGGSAFTSFASTVVGGSPLYAGGGGAAVCGGTGGTATPGAGGAAVVLIYA